MAGINEKNISREDEIGTRIGGEKLIRAEADGNEGAFRKGLDIVGQPKNLSAGSAPSGETFCKQTDR